MLGRNVRHKNLDGRRIVVTLAGLLCLLGLTGLLTGRTGFRAAGRRLEVAFRDAHGLRTGSAVRIAGLDVGRVVDVGLTERDRSPRALIVIALPPVLADRLRQDVQLAIEEGRDGQSRIKILSAGQSDASLAPGQVVQGVEWSAWDGLADQLGLAPDDLSPWRPLLEELRLALAARTAQKEASAQSTETLASQDSPPAEPASPAAEPAALPSPSPAPAPEPVVVAEPPPAPAAQLPVVVAAEPPAPAPDAGPAPAPEPRPITWGRSDPGGQRHEAQPAPLPPAVTNNAMPLPLADATATPAPATVAAPTQYPVESPTPNPARPWLFVDAVQLAPTPVASAEPKPVALETVDPGDRKYDTRPDPLVANVGGDPAPDRAATAPGAPIDLERITPPDPIVMSVASSGLSAPSQSEPVNCAECRALGHGVEMVAPAERPLRDEAVQQAQVPSDLAPPPARTPPTPTYPAPAPPPAATPSPAPTPTPSPAPTPTPSPAPTPTPPRPDTAGPPPTTTTAPTPTPSPSPEPATAAPSTATPSAPATAQPSTPTAAASPSATTPSGPSPAEDYAQISAANLSAEAAAAGLGFSDAPVMIGDQAPFSIRQALSPTPPTPPHPPVPPVPGQHPKSAIFVPWARGFKIADNQSPRPQDRFFYSFDYFNNLNGSINSRIGADVSHIKIYRELIGVEKTFLDGNASIGLRMPINTLTADSPLKGLGGTNTAVGNLTVFSKLILWQDQKGRNLVSGGLAVTVPNGPTSFAGSPSVNGFHDAQIQPFIGYIFANDNWFVQGFEAIDVPTDPNDVTAMYNDLGIGYFLYRNKDPNALISMIAPTFETHVNVPLNHVGFRLNDPAGTPNVVDLTYGVNILLRRSAMLTLGFVDPVTGPRPFSYEWQLLLNVYFGRTRARGAQVTPTPPLGGN